MKQWYIKVPDWFVEKYKGHCVGDNSFNATQNLSGDWVTGVGAYLEFPDIMGELEGTGWNYEANKIELGNDDFLNQ